MSEGEPLKKPSGANYEPLEAVVYIKGVDAYVAEVYETRTMWTAQPIVEYTYWIYIVDTGFAGRNISDSIDNEANTIDVKFTEFGKMPLKGFWFRHLAGNIFRVKFRMDIEQGKVVSQDLSMTI